MRKSKLLFMILAVVVVLAMVVACGNNDDPPAGQDDPPAGQDDPVVTGPVDIPRPPGVAYSLATDSWIQHLAVGERDTDLIFDGTSALNSAGPPRFTVIDSPAGGNGIQVSFREESWHAVDLALDGMGITPANTYLLVVTGRHGTPGSNIHLGDTYGPWSWHVSADTDAATGAFELSLVVDLDFWLHEGMQNRVWLRLGSSVYGEGHDIFIYSITVTETGAAPGLAYALSADANIQGKPVGERGSGYEFFEGSPLQTAGNPRFTIVDGLIANSILVEFRDEGWYTLDLILFGAGNENIHGLDLANNEYVLFVIGEAAVDEGGTGSIGGADAPWAGLASADQTYGLFRVSWVLTYDSVMGVGDYPGVGVGGDGRVDSRHARLGAGPGLPNFTIHEIALIRQ